MTNRYRRIAWAGSTLATLAVIGGLIAWKIHRDSQPEEYTPGETSSDITSTVSEKAAGRSAPQNPDVRAEVKSRVSDPLLDPGRRLPDGAPPPRFTDVTHAAGLAAFRQFNGARSSQLPEDMGSGLAWGDFDNDGFDDLFLVSGGGTLNLPVSQLAPSLLYRNLGDGRFIPSHDFPETRIRGMGAAWGDVDNDGWLDLVVTGYDAILLFRNERGHFVRDKQFPSPKGFWAGASWGDYNRDGALDLYVCGYVKYLSGQGDAGRSTQQFGKEVPFTLNPASYEAERNLLFRNTGRGAFSEVARELGVSNPEGRSLSALWHDFDGDGWLDLYVANDISENKLYLNRAGRFIDGGRAAWVEEYRGSMGLAAADFDRDNDDDLFISHWIAQQYALYQSLLAEQRMSGDGRTDLHFTEVAAMRGIGQPSMQSIGWGASFGDFDSDGWPDLMVANGSTFEEKSSDPRTLVPMPSFFFWSARGDYFHDLAPWNRQISKPFVSRCLAVADFDNDGALDIAIIDHGAGVRLLRNDLPHGNWIEFRLRSRLAGSRKALGFADGASLTAWIGKVPLRRTVTSASYLSQDSRRVHIGLGGATRVDRLEVRWPDGRTDEYKGLDANRIWEIDEGESQPRLSVSIRQMTRTEIPVFWEKQRAAMDAMKRENQPAKAARLFREVLALDPAHEDSRYYLANSLAATGDVPAAIAELGTLTQISPQSRRGFQRKGELEAASAATRAQLESARTTLQAGLRLNSEETGTLVLLGEAELALGNLTGAERHLSHACQANARAADAWFLRSYIAWKRGDAQQATSFLNSTRSARGTDFKPAGSALEGDVQRRMFEESGFLSVFAKTWDGRSGPESAFQPLERYLSRFR